MQAGTYDPGTPQRKRRVKSALLSLTGLLVALALIVGGLTGLGRDVLPNDGWPTFDGGREDSAVVLAPAEKRPAPATTEATADALEDAAPPAIVPHDRDDAATVTRTSARDDAASTGGTAAPRERTVRAEQELPVGEQRDETDTVTGFRASIDTDRDGLTDVHEKKLGTDALSRDTDGDALPDGWEARNGLNPTDLQDADSDTDGDGLRARTEFRVKSNPRAPDTDANGRPDGEDDTDGDGMSNGAEDDHPTANPTVADADPVTEPLVAPETPVTPPAPEPQHVAPPAPAAPEAAPAPAPAVAETPAPAASPALSSP